MKTLIILITTLIFIFNSFAQDCIDFANYDQPYIDSVNNLPVGSTLFSSGNLKLVRPDQSSQYLNLDEVLLGDTALLLSGNLKIDVSSANCPNKQLTFTTSLSPAIVVDGDTAYSGTSITNYYQGISWVFEAAEGPLNTLQVNISGDFDTVQLISTGQQFIYDICLECLVGVHELEYGSEKELVQILDLTGRKTEDKPNTILIYVYSDGTTEKVFRIE